MTEDIKVNINKVPIRYFIKMLTEPNNTSVIFDILEQSVEGGIQDLPVSYLPALMGKLTKELTEHAASIALAVNSMRNYLDGKDN